MRAVDTNVLVRLIANDHPRQGAAAEAFVRPGAWVSLIVAAEVMWVLESRRGFDRERLALSMDLLLNQKSLSFQDADVVSAALQRFRSHLRVCFSDCLVLESARKAGHLPLGTFDRDLAKLEGAELLKAAS